MERRLVLVAFFRPYLIPVMIGTEVHAVYNRKTGIKGALHFLIFPLLARKLIADTWLEERKGIPIITALAWAIAMPLEVLRHPMALVHLLRSLVNELSCTSLQDSDETLWNGILLVLAYIQFNCSLIIMFISFGYEKNRYKA